MTTIIAFIVITLVMLVIVLFSLWVADKAATAAATKFSANKSETKVTIRRWNFWGVVTHSTTAKEIWYQTVYNFTLDVVFNTVMWAITNALSTSARVINNRHVGVY